MDRSPWPAPSTPQENYQSCDQVRLCSKKGNYPILLNPSSHAECPWVDMDISLSGEIPNAISLLEGLDFHESNFYWKQTKLGTPRPNSTRFCQQTPFLSPSAPQDEYLPQIQDPKQCTNHISVTTPTSEQLNARLISLSPTRQGTSHLLHKNLSLLQLQTFTSGWGLWPTELGYQSQTSTGASAPKFHQKWDVWEPSHEVSHGETATKNKMLEIPPRLMEKLQPGLKKKFWLKPRC